MIGSAAAIAFLWLTEIPLGIPGEWAWNRVRLDRAPLDEVLLGVALTVVVACLYAGFGWLGALRMMTAGRGERAAWLGGATFVGFWWLWIVQQTPADVGYRLPKAAFVLYYPGPSGYFDEARYAITDVRSFLAGYEARMADGDVLHAGTHPPGLFVLHRWLIALCEDSPGLTRLLLDTQPDAVREAFSTIEKNTQGTPRQLLDHDRAAIWLAALLTQLAGVLTFVPLYLLLRRDYSPLVSWQTALLWPLVPALAVFLPKSDALFPFLGMAFLWVWLEGVARRSALMCLLAGLIFWLALSLSLAVVPVGLLAAVLTVWETRIAASTAAPRQSLGRLIVSVLWALVAFFAIVVVIWAVYDLNLLSVWLWNFRNHQGFYDVYPRTYWKWLLINPIELALFVGIPIVVAVLAGYRQIVGRNWRQRKNGSYWCCAIVWGLLWLSGKNSGEAARLWLVLMPWLVWLVGGFLAETARSAEAETGDVRFSSERRWLLLLSLQLAVCLLTVARVTGFDFALK